MLLANGFLSDRREYKFDIQKFHAGDKIELDIQGNEKEYIIMAVIGTMNSLNMSSVQADTNRLHYGAGFCTDVPGQPKSDPLSA